MEKSVRRPDLVRPWKPPPPVGPEDLPPDLMGLLSLILGLVGMLAKVLDECNGIACCSCMHSAPPHEHVPPKPVLAPRLLVAAMQCEWHPSSSDCFECLLASRRSNQTKRNEQWQRNNLLR